jgi:hypothetical protein
MGFEADARLKLLPTGPLKAGEPNEIPLALEGPPISCITDDLNEFSVVSRHHGFFLRRRLLDGKSGHAGSSI